MEPHAEEVFAGNEGIGPDGLWRDGTRAPNKFAMPRGIALFASEANAIQFSQVPKGSAGHQGLQFAQVGGFAFGQFAAAGDKPANRPPGGV